MNSQHTPPGWYPDPHDRRRQRYWTGQQWLNYSQPATVRPTSETRTRPGRWRSGWLVVAAVILPVGLAGALILAVALASAPGTKVPERSSAATPAAETTSSSAPAEPTPVRVPLVRGSSRYDARAALRTADLKVGLVRTSPSARPRGTVLQQTPHPGRSVDPGTPIDIVIATPLPRVPDVTGLSPTAARQQLSKAGFRVTTSTKVVTSGADNVVLSESPAAGTSRQPKSVVSVVIADLHRPPPPPSPAPVQTNCTAGYSPCLPYASDYDCAGGSGDGPKYVSGTVRITGSDPYDLDADGDGYGCD